MASTAIEKVIGQFDRMKMAAKNAKIKEHVKSQNMYAMGSAVLGAVAAGAIDAKYNPDGTSKKTTIALVATGAVLGVGAVTDYIPGGLVIGMGGIGVLCYVAGKTAHDKMKDHIAANPAT